MGLGSSVTRGCRGVFRREVRFRGGLELKSSLLLFAHGPRLKCAEALFVVKYDFAAVSSSSQVFLLFVHGPRFKRGRRLLRRFASWSTISRRPRAQVKSFALRSWASSQVWPKAAEALFVVKYDFAAASSSSQVFLLFVHGPRLKCGQGCSGALRREVRFRGGLELK